MDKKKILFVAGGISSQYLFETGIFYSASADDKTFEKYEIQYAVLFPDGKINFPKSLEKEDYEQAQKYDIFEGGSLIKKMKIDVIFYLPSSWKGLTSYRTVFELLDIPIAGPTAESQNLAFNKILTRAKLATEGIKLPPGCVVKYEDKDNLQKVLNQFREKEFTLPVIVKAPCEDDSLGLTVVKEEKDLIKAINHAFEYQNKDEILIEKFIEGREIRTAVIQDENLDLLFLPVCEYGIDPKKIRENKHKIYEYRALTGQEMEVIDRIILKPEKDGMIIDRLKKISFDCFKGLNIKDWAVFDFRYNQQEDEFYFIEAGLFVHFSVSCNIGKLARDIGISQQQHFDWTFNNAIKRFNQKKLIENENK